MNTTTHSLDTDAVLGFWFEELGPEDWYSGDPKIDERIEAQFAQTCAAVLAAPPERFLGDARTALAAIIVLDQFTRNIHRRTANAFAGDPGALSIAHGAIERGYDNAMTQAERQFLYMPLMHSEVLADQELSVKLFRDLGNENSLKFAIEHRDIVARFGRFPHRNQALGRTSTKDEIDFLKGHSGYGQ
ncbi:DUF924 family protein [Nitratireductor sp. StC3]|uniref:DUF924 family protein n=1 Tax=Nitratireductor sp. StC3 TaxID=2126741 RepID=UPI000D0E3102|nr:DUF924 family protein [Nitratireductor sp. StC3]PSM16776.1 DUF924 domain-containing protein [Nitratireductor sp. StC3]